MIYGMRRFCLAAMLGALLLAPMLVGCKVGPDYVAPDTATTMPGGFQTPEDPSFVTGEANIVDWWIVFDDGQLVELIERARIDNLDLRIAISRVTEARARLGIAESGNVPSVAAGGSALRGQESSAIDPVGGGTTRTRYDAGLDASWELDVFGKVAREVEAATAEFQATEEDQRDVAVSLYAEVARTYLAVRAYQSQLAVAESNIRSQREILTLTRTRYETGISSRLDVAQAESVLASSEAEVPPLRIELARAINTMGLLLAQYPVELHDELEEPKPIPVPPVEVAVGVPANLLRQRPDIRAAERRLAAQTALIGVATADLYPQFSLIGNFGFASLGTSDLFDAGSRAFSLGPSFRWSLFDGGRVRSQIKVEEARTEQAVLAYERTVLSAMEEVETAMVAFTEQRIRVDALERAAAAARQTLELATDLYREGLTDFQGILDAQRSLFAYEGAVAEARGTASTNLVRLYKALGGGWDPDEVDGPVATEAPVSEADPDLDGDPATREDDE